MIITRTPFRISIGGGGTDLPSYYGQHGGFLVSAAINKYVYIMVNQRFEESIRVSYSKTEIAERVEDIQHPIVREALRLLGIDSNLEVVSIADLPSNSGLGSSSSFTVGLLHALHILKRDPISPRQLAEEAFHLEVAVLGEPIGKQDQYAAAYGGIICMEIDPTGEVSIEHLPMDDALVQDFENNVIFLYTGIQRPASEVLSEQNQAFQRAERDPTEAMHAIKAIGQEIRAVLSAGQLSRFGELMDLHWQEKKRLSAKVSSGMVDHWYEVAKSNGALGGKLMGAGGGGFFMFYSHNSDKKRLRAAMKAEGLREVRFLLDFEGSKLVANV